MLRSITLLVFSFVLSFSVGQKLMVCYYGSWSTWRQGNGACSVSDLDPFICTHLVYAFVGLNNDATIKVMDPRLELPVDGGRDNFREFNKLKLRNPNLKTTVAIGGWSEGSAKFSRMANDPTLRAKFVKEASSFITKYGFDGLDVDWEYPGQRDSPNGNRDIAAFTQLLKELRTEFDQFGFLLTAAVGAPGSIARLSYDIPEISKYLHYIHVMSYDFAMASDGKTGHNSAMRQYDMTLPPGMSNDIETVYNYWLSQGAPKEKLIMGIPLYGRTFRLTNTQDHSVGAAVSGVGIAGQYTLEGGMIGLNELCEKRKTDSWPEEWDMNAQVPYTYKGSDWISYDDHRSIQIKANYAMSLDLAGLMVWSIDTDDFRGICGEKFGYLRTMNSAIRGTSSSTTTKKPTTTTIKPTTTTIKPTTTTIKPTTTTIKPTTTTKKPTTTTIKPTTTTIKPTTTTKKPTTTTIKPTTTTIKPTTTTKKPTTTTIKPTTTTIKPTTTTIKPTTTTTRKPTSTTMKAPITSTLRPVPSTTPNSICIKEGFTRDKNNCSVFYYCMNIGNNEFTVFNFKCPDGLYIDLVSLICNWPELVDCKM